MKCCKNYVCLQCADDIYECLLSYLSKIFIYKTIEIENKKIEDKCWWCGSLDCEIINTNEQEQVILIKIKLKIYLKFAFIIFIFLLTLFFYNPLEHKFILY